MDTLNFVTIAEELQFVEVDPEIHLGHIFITEAKRSGENGWSLGGHNGGELSPQSWYAGLE